jgi:hypothetical protein
VFTALTGEPWGYMGSKRLLYEMYRRDNSGDRDSLWVAGLHMEDIDQV